MPLSEQWPGRPHLPPRRGGALESWAALGCCCSAASSVTGVRGQLGSSGNSIGRNNELLRARHGLSDQETYRAVTVTDGPRGPSPRHCPSDLDCHPRSVCPLMLTGGGRVVGRRSTMQPVEQLKAMCSCRRLF